MKRLRHDLNYTISAALLIVAVVVIVTGLVAQLWDLNDFVYHTYAGYAMTLLALAHVWLNWQRMIGYFRFRLTRREHSRAQPVAGSQGALTAPATNAAHAGTQSRRAQDSRLSAVSRRGFLGLALGGLGGFVAGRGLRPPPVIARGSDLGVVYHQWSKPGVIEVLGSVASWGQQPSLYKTYPNLPAIVLPEPKLAAGLPTEEAILRRRSTRAYSGTAMTLPELSRLLFCMGGVSSDRWGHGLRTAPSSGALYPIEIYAAVHNVAGLEPGLYHYAVQQHGLEQIQRADLREAVVRQGLMQQFLGQANLVIFLTVIFQRMRWKYQDRTYRYGLIEAGHLGQNLYLAATSMGLGACGVGAFMDDEINRMLGVDGVEEAAIYMLAVGNI
ncbi:MAG TPA: SagB/ThcOx family dehydrogenase [Herpetosiphonaceae bacterium]